MAFIGHHIATVPSVGFRWYLIFLEGSLRDPVKEEIDKHFYDLASMVDRDIIVVRGFDPSVFRESVYELNPEWGNRVRFPALLVTDKHPAQATENPESVDEARVFLFSLKAIYEKDNTLAEFFIDLIETLNNPEAIQALERVEKRQQRRDRWKWLNKYSMLDLNIWGLGIRGNELLADIADL